MSFICNSIICLRAPEPEDLELLYNWENQSENWIFGNTNVPFSKYNLRQFIENSNNDIYSDKQVRFMIDSIEYNVTVGTIDLFDFDPFHSRIAIGILIEKNFRNKSFASNSIKLIIDYIFNKLSIYQIFATINENNQASIDLFEKQGFSITARRKKWIKENNIWYDEITMQLFNPLFPHN